ncbi:aldo/keto reductase [candidate division KSB1 bacterium]|nr:aldo/keto reductase [candidate division KSB1 bacterium]
MNQRILGRTGIAVSEIAFGGVEIGLPYGIGVTSQADMPSDAVSIKILHAALEQGINFYDTARLYGRSEDIIGRAFKGQRDRVVLCSKCTHIQKDGGKLPDADSLSAIINNSLQESRSSLQTDYLDVYMLHNATLEILENSAVADTFLALKRAGIVRAIGVSTYSEAETKRAIEQGYWDVIQLAFNLMDQRQAAFFDAAHAARIGLVVRSVLLKGILSDRGRNLHPALVRVEDHRKCYLELLNARIPTLSNLATKFALSFPQVSSVLVGIDRLAYLQGAVAAADGHYLDSDALARAQELAFPDPEFVDLPAWDRVGWLK